MLSDVQFEAIKKAVYQNPTGYDISKLEPSAYKFFDGYRNLVYMFREEQITKDECIAKINVLMKEYKDNIDAYTRYIDICHKYQDTIKATDSFMTDMIKGNYSTADTLLIALELISMLRGEDVSRVAILRRLNIEPYMNGQSETLSVE